jgi:hypothetical protein
VHRVTAQGHISFASTHGKSPGESVPHRGIQQPLWPEHCVQGTPGADHPTDLTQHRWDHVVRKGSALDADASSPFRDLHGADLGLAAFLRERGVQARLRAAVRPCWWGHCSARTPATLDGSARSGSGRQLGLAGLISLELYRCSPQVVAFPAVVSRWR